MHFAITGTAAFENHQCQLKHPNSNFDVDSPGYDDACEAPVGVFLGFLLSLYWTNTIIMVCIIIAACCQSTNDPGVSHIVLFKEYRTSDSVRSNGDMVLQQDRG